MFITKFRAHDDHKSHENVILQLDHHSNQCSHHNVLGRMCRRLETFFLESLLFPLQFASPVGERSLEWSCRLCLVERPKRKSHRLTGLVTLEATQLLLSVRSICLLDDHPVMLELHGSNGVERHLAGKICFGFAVVENTARLCL